MSKSHRKPPKCRDIRSTRTKSFLIAPLQSERDAAARFAAPVARVPGVAESTTTTAHTSTSFDAREFHPKGGNDRCTGLASKPDSAGLPQTVPVSQPCISLVAQVPPVDIAAK